MGTTMWEEILLCIGVVLLVPLSPYLLWKFLLLLLDLYDMFIRRHADELGAELVVAAPAVPARRQVHFSLPENQTTDPLECRICYYRFSNSAKKTPRILMCGHTVCTKCIQMMTAQSIDVSSLECPFCRYPTFYITISDLHVNTAMLDIVKRKKISKSCKIWRCLTGKSPRYPARILPKCKRCKCPFTSDQGVCFPWIIRNCGHTICESCIREEGNNIISCSECPNSFPRAVDPQEWNLVFTKNYAILDVIAESEEL